MRKLFFAVLLILLNSNIVSQIIYQNILILPQGDPLGELNGLGNSGLVNSVSNIGFINPAGLNNFDKISFGTTYEFENKIDEAWIAQIGFRRDMNFVPQSAGFVLPAGNFRVGFAFSQGYNGGIDVGIVAITDPNHPDGGEYTKVVNINRLYNYSLMASYLLIGDASAGSSFSIGGKFNINRLKVASDPYSIELKFGGNNWAAGGMFTHRFEDDKFYSIGLFFEKNIPMEIKESSLPGLTVTPGNPGGNRPPAYSGFVITPIRAEFPSKLKLDFDISLLSRIRFLGNVSEIFWHSVEARNSDQMEFSGGLAYRFNDIISSSAGFITSGKRYDEVDALFHTNENLRAVFLTLGTEIKIKDLLFDFSIADSHTFSGGWRKQTIGRVGVGYSL